MARRIGGFRRKTRDKLKKHHSEKSKLRINALLTHYHEGQRVLLKIDPSTHTGMLHPRFHGRTGTITGTQGTCYTLTLHDGNKPKTLIVHPAHLKLITPR